MDVDAVSQIVLLSLRIAALATAGCVIPAVGLAWLLARRRFPGRTLLDALVHAPLVLPPVVVGYCLLGLFGSRTWLGEWLVRTLGVHLPFTTGGAVMAAAVMALPLMVRSIRLGLEGIDRGLETAARTLGASRLDTFFSITLPLMLPGIVAGAVLAFAASLGEFGATITFAANIPDETRTLTLAIYTALQTPDGEASAKVLVMISMGLAIGALLLAEVSNRVTKNWLRAQ
ncbi:MAG: molybdate ABC transporter permease subunit [Gammaproteobacteria bacterium]|jgi:molybdate transport system permease protein|nr:molybdate ABC transporter permease subunit [Gammaproteobacteria bacterium]